MQVNVAELAKAEVGEAFDFSIAATVPELPDLPGLANLQSAGSVTKLADSALVTGSVEATLPLTCARCLVEFIQPLTVDYREEFVANPADGQFKYQGTKLDLAPMLRTVLLLEIPLSPLHHPDCRGLCRDCGVDLNEAPSPHGHHPPDQPSDNPFRQLKDLTG